MAELAKRQQIKEAAQEKRKPTAQELELADYLENLLYDKQKEAWLHPAKRKVLCTSRRVGKSTMLILGSCIHLLRRPQENIMYVSKTLRMAKPQYFDALRNAITDYNLPFDVYLAEMRIEHQRGGGCIYTKGAETDADIQNLVGFKLSLAMLDEAGLFGPKMEAAVLSKIGPSLRDLEGTLILTGTPSLFPEGLFYEAATGINKTFTQFHWTLVDNPHLPESARDLVRIIAEEGFSSMEDPRFIREYLGRFAIATERQVFDFDPARNVYQHIDLDGYEYLIGADFGVSDASAVVVLAFKRDTYKLYAVESWEKEKATVDEVADVIKVYMNRYTTKKVVGDKGGLGKAYTNEIWQRHQIYIDTAEKRDKLEFIGVLNSWLKSGNLMIRHESSLAKEIPYVLWNQSRTAVDNHAKDDNCHALLYAFRGVLPLIRRKPDDNAGVFVPDPSIDYEKERLLTKKPELETPHEIFNYTFW